MTTTPGTAQAFALSGIGHAYRSRGTTITALADIDLSVSAGECLVVVGPSGSGKSTLLRLLAGFVTPTTGEIRIGGSVVRGPGSDRGVVFQQPRLFPWLSVRRNVEFGLRSLPRQLRRTVAREHLALVGLGDVEHLRPYELSGGMQQRVAIARALAPGPGILLMDEPFAALDALTRERMQEELRRLWQLTGTTIVFITHSVDEAAYLGTRIIALTARPGRIALDLTSPVPATPQPRRSGKFIEVRERVNDVVRRAAGDDPAGSSDG